MRRVVEAVGTITRPMIVASFTGDSDRLNSAATGSRSSSGTDSGSAATPSMSVSVRAGSAYARIVEFSEELQADMIMIGHRGLTNLQRFFLGSVAAKVVAHAPCSVYVHRPKPEA